MSLDVRVARMALDIIRTSGLAHGMCNHPAEALEHDGLAARFLCSVCTISVTEEVVARVIADPDAPRVTIRLEPLPRRMWLG